MSEKKIKIGKYLAKLQARARLSYSLCAPQTTRVDPLGDNLRQVRSWYDHPMPSFSVLAADTLSDLVTFWP